MAISATVTPGATLSDGETVTISKLNALGTPTVDIAGAVGSLAITSDAIANIHVQAAAAVQYSKLEALSTNQLVVGNAGTPTATTLTGDISISAAGLVTVSTAATVPDNAITLAKLEDGTQGDLLYYGASGAPARLGFGTNGQFLKTQGTGANPVWADAGTPSVTVTPDDTAIDDDTTVTIPANTFLVIGTIRFTMSGNNGAKAEAEILDSSDTVLDTVVLGGGNETAGTDGGSGMTVRDSFTIGVPSNCATVRIYKGAGSNSIVGEVTQFVKLS